jgi:hypothetical protein
MRYLFGFILVLVLALGVMGCGETAGTGGSGGDAGTGGTAGTGGGGTGGNGATCQDHVCPCTEAGIRAAIAEGGGPFTFDCDGHQTVVTEAEIVIDNDVILDGEGNLTVDGRGQHHRVFEVAEDVTVEFHGLSIGLGFAGDGGCIFNAGTLTLTNSTVSACTAGFGGGIFNTGTLTLANSTVSEDGATDTGGIANAGTLTLTNSLVDGDCIFDPVTSNGYNIESPGDTCGFDQPTDQVSVTEEQLNLGPLQDNGGPTMTHALGEGSVAIDVIPTDMCAPDTDQRGFPRDSMCDVGAFEVQP